MSSISHHEFIMHSFRENPKRAFAYLNEVIKDKDSTHEDCTNALNNVIMALGNSPEVIAHAKSLIDKETNCIESVTPSFENLLSICHAFNMQITFTPTSVSYN